MAQYQAHTMGPRSAPEGDGVIFVLLAFAAIGFLCCLTATLGVLASLFRQSTVDSEYERELAEYRADLEAGAQRCIESLAAEHASQLVAVRDEPGEAAGFQEWVRDLHAV